MNTIPELIEDIRAGRMIILVDDESRENEGDLVLAADFVTPQAINFMATEARGLICLSMTGEQISRLGLPLMVREDINSSPNRTAFTVSIEAAQGVSTGISAADRSHTIRVASNPLAKGGDVITPGHVFPIRAQEGGVLKRAGHTEASVDLAILAGLSPAAVICEIMNPDGTMARVPELKEFAKKHNIKIGTIEDLIEYRLENESFIEERAFSPILSAYGEGFGVKLFKNKLDGREHLALVKGDITTDEPALVRVHTENVMGDVFGSLTTRSGEYLRQSMEMINRVGRGVILYLRNEGMQGRLEERIRSYAATVSAEGTEDMYERIFRSDRRDYGVGAQILRSLGLKRIILISNNPKKRVGLKAYGIEIVDSVPVNLDKDKNFTDKENRNDSEKTH